MCIIIPIHNKGEWDIMLRKSMAALLAAAMVMSALTGCSGSNDSADSVKEPQHAGDEPCRSKEESARKQGIFSWRKFLGNL